MNSKALALALFLFLLAVYLLTYSGVPESSDGLSMIAVTESLIKRADYDTNQLLWMGLQQGSFGRGGELYSRKSLGNSIAALPLAFLGQVVPMWGFVQSTMLLNAIITALTGALVYLFVETLSYSKKTSLIVALIFGLGTTAWPYSKYFFSEPLTGLGLVACAYFLLRYRKSQSNIDSVLAGFSMGLAVAARTPAVVALPLFFLALLCYWHRGARLIPNLVSFFLPLAFWGLLLGAYNYLRFNSFLETGYLPQESFTAPWLTGIVGLLVSPGRGILLYSPILLASLFAFPLFLRRHRLEGLLFLALFLSQLLFYGKWFMWHGGFAWGPRFLIPTLPFLTIPLGPLVDSLRGRKALAFFALVAVSGLVQILGLVVAFGLFQDWLSHQEALFALVTFFDVRYSPMLGQFKFLRIANLDFAWAQPMDWLALGLGLIVVVTAAWTLAHTFKGSPQSSRALLATAVLLLVSTGFSLALYKDKGGMAELARFIEEYSSPQDAIILNAPQRTTMFQNNYRGHLPVYGLFAGPPALPEETEQLLSVLMERYPRLWLTPGGLPSETSGLDDWLSQAGYRALEETFGEERLALYGFPKEPLAEWKAEAIFGDRIILESCEYLDRAAPGDILPLELHWRAVASPGEDYQVFIHLVDAGGKRWAQRDGPPGYGTYPTSTWSTGEEIVDKRAILLPKEMPKGEYRLLVGLYRLSDGQRLNISQGGDSLSIAPILVQ